MLEAGQISSDEARAGRRDIRNELDYFSELIDFARSLALTAKANMILCSVIFAGGVAIEIFLHGKACLQAMESAVFLVSGNIPVFVLPVAIPAFFVGASAHSFLTDCGIKI